MVTFQLRFFDKKRFFDKEHKSPYYNVYNHMVFCYGNSESLLNKGPMNSYINVEFCWYNLGFYSNMYFIMKLILLCAFWHHMYGIYFSSLSIDFFKQEEPEQEHKFYVIHFF